MIIVAVAMPVIIGSLAWAVDTGVWFKEVRRTQQMADAATVGAVRVIKDGASVATARQVALNDARLNGYSEAEADSSFSFHSPALSGPYAGQVNTAEVIIKRQLPRFFSLVAATTTARSVSFKPVILGKNLEVALMLDVSSSMSGSTEVEGVTKLKAMQDAAKALVDTVVQSQQSPYTSRVALAPYSTAVNVGSTYYTAVTGAAVSGSWTSVVERTTAQYSDAPPSEKLFGTFKYMKQFAKSDNGSPLWSVRDAGSNAPSSASRIRPLSTDKQTLKSAIGGLATSGRTAGHLGVAWTWYLLSPRWSTVWSGAAPNAYDPAGTYKAAVLMSDFEMNTYYAGSDNSSKQTRELCAEMKKAGIVIYTVGYKVPANNATAVDLWNDCATDPDKVFSADTVAELLAAFKAIAAATLNRALNDDISLGE